MKKNILSLMVGCICCFAWGQDNTDVKGLINKIKKSQSYLSAEATMPNEEDAYKLANELLVEEINEWVKSKRKSETIKQVVLQDISSCAEKMNMKRGSNYRAFVYTKKKDIIPIYGNGQIVLSENERGSDLQALSEISEPLRIETEKKPAGKEEIQPEVKPQSDLDKILSTSTMDEMKLIFSDMKGRDAIAYASYPSPDAIDNCYLLFYRRDGIIRAVVNKTGDNWLNLKTNQVVKPADFSGCGAYWFILK